MTHFVVIHALTGSCYPRRRSGNTIGNGMMDIDPWRSPCMVKVDEEAHEVSCLIEEVLGPKIWS